jgi:hypothetical protein
VITDSRFNLICSLILTVAVVTFSPLTSAIASTAPQKNTKTKSATSKTIHAKDLKASLRPKTFPGRSLVPVANNGDFPSSPAGYSVKLRPAKKPARAASNIRLVTRPVAAFRSPASTDPVSSYMRPLRVGYNGPVPQLALGQALAVSDSYIVTSADFVSDAWTNSGDVHFYVPDSNQALALVGFDLGSNLAIFTTGLGSHMEHSLPLQRLRTETPVAGEDFASLGSGGLVMGARRVRPVQDLTFVRERFELPAAVALSAGSSGVQFLFDKSGRWVGSVSLLDQRDGRKFDVTSANQTYQMIHQLEQHAPVVLSSSTLQQQAVSWQERWTNTFFESAKKGYGLQSLDCQADALHVDDQKIASQLLRTRLVHCSNTMPVALTHDFSMGVELVTGDIAYTNDVKAFLAADQSPTTVFSQPSNHRAPASINLMTGPECEKSEVTNSQNHHLHVRFCTAALKNVAGLNDTTITVISSDTGLKSTLHSLHLRGFEPKNAKRFMEWMIETETLK